MRILIVDDCAETKCRDIIRRCLEQGINVEIKTAVNPALYYLTRGKEKVDGIILDMGLPIYKDERVWNSNEGETILRELKRKKQDIPVLVFSDTPVNTSSYAHIFDQMKDWYVVQEAEKFERFLQELQRREEE